MTFDEKRLLIESLLDHWEDFFTPSEGGFATGTGEGIGIAFVSGMSKHHSVVELARCLGVLQRMAPRHFAHLAGHYRSEWRTVDQPAKIRNAHGKQVDVIARVRVRVLPAWIEPRLVANAVAFLVGVWNFDAVVLELPRALRRKLREFTDGDGTHLTEAREAA